MVTAITLATTEDKGIIWLSKRGLGKSAELGHLHEYCYQRKQRGDCFAYIKR
jgi:hypothetical protein